MKITWQPSDETGRSGLHAFTEHYDAVPPISKLLTDGSPRLLTGDRMGVAAALAFGHFSSGSIVLPRPVGPGVAQAVEEYCAGSWTVVGPVSFEPVALPIGTTTVVIGAARDYLPVNRWGQVRQIKLDIRRSDAYAGQLVSVDEFVLASNAWLHAATEETGDIRHYLGELAVAVLFAESLQADSIALPAHVDLSSEASRKIANLLAAGRLGLLAGSQLAL